MTVAWVVYERLLITLLVSGGATGALIAWWWLTSGFGAEIQKLDRFSPKAVVELVGWERDRMMAAAKGIASTSAAFLVSLVSLLLRGELSIQVSGWAVAGLGLGAIGCLSIAASLSAESRKFVDRHVTT